MVRAQARREGGSVPGGLALCFWLRWASSTEQKAEAPPFVRRSTWCARWCGEVSGGD
jgi:hypothetical protein